MAGTEGQENAANRGICPTCGRAVPVRHDRRGSSVFLTKECPVCGPSETQVSTDAARYWEKRDLIGYRGEAGKTCSLDCQNCNRHKPPTLVFLDVTNRCNMNCPICLANIPAMGFRFDPPREYFDKVFAKLSQMAPPPKVQLFGGEPTCREDLIELIELARDKYGVEARVVTNGIRLADEDYCRRLLATGCQLMFSFDGRSPRIYERTRRHASAYAKKLEALENVRKHHRSKITLMVCVGEGVNDEFLADLVDYCHERRDFIAAMDLIPLTATWGPEQVDARNATIEDVERLMAKQVPGMAFFPAGVFSRLQALRDTFAVGRLTFGGAHPNCEAVSALVSDGQRYQPIATYMKRPLNEVASDLLALDRRMQERLPRSILGRFFGGRGRRCVYGWHLYRLARRHLDLDRIAGGAPSAKLVRILWGLAWGVHLKHLLRTHTNVHSLLRVIVLPFEEKGAVEAARLVDCPAQFAYEHPLTGEIRFMPVCAWVIHKNGILRQTTARYGIARDTGDGSTTASQQHAEPVAEPTAPDGPKPRQQTHG